MLNSTALRVGQVYLTLPGAGVWGTNQLADTILPGESGTLSGIAPGRYDVLAVASDESRFMRYGVQLAEKGSFTWTLVSSTGSLQITNDHASPITEVYVSSASSLRWGSNQLAAPIPVGDVLTLDVAYGLRDLRLVAADGAWIERCGVSFSSSEVVPWMVSITTPTTGAVTVVNGFGYPITELYVASPTGWWPNRLSAPIPVGRSFTITDLPPGLVDLRAVVPYQATVERLDLPVTAGAVSTWTVMTTPPTGSVIVENGYSHPLTALYVAPSTWSTWEPNRLNRPLLPSGHLVIPYRPPGLIYLRAAAADGTFAELHDVVVEAGGVFLWTVTTTQPPPSLTVLNRSSVYVSELYVFPTGAMSWGLNRLKGVFLPPGGSFTLTALPPDTYDFRARGGGYWERSGELLAPGTSFTWTLEP